jgi:hypothetical protein
LAIATCGFHGPGAKTEGTGFAARATTGCSTGARAPTGCTAAPATIGPRTCSRGHDGNDTLDGAGGDDRLFGGFGNDTLTGGDGADRFYIRTFGAENADSITDFDQASGDRIWLDSKAFVGLAPGAVPEGAFRLGTTAQDADDRILFHAATGDLYYDPTAPAAAARTCSPMSARRSRRARASSSSARAPRRRRDSGAEARAVSYGIRAQKAGWKFAFF